MLHLIQLSVLMFKMGHSEEEINAEFQAILKGKAYLEDLNEALGVDMTEHQFQRTVMALSKAKSAVWYANMKVEGEAHCDSL